MNAPFFPRAQSAAEPAPDAAFLADVLEGLSLSQKTVSAKYFYDLEGSRLFEDITRLREYYPTRTELSILRGAGPDFADFCPSGATVVEFGSGSTEKIRVLLSQLPDVRGYVPIDVSADFLSDEAAKLRADRPDLDIQPVVADFVGQMQLPPALVDSPLIGFFPGSTIGNFEPASAGALIARFARLLGAGAVLIIGVDLVKDDTILQAAYDDAAGITGRFNLNLLSRINRELGADFDLTGFAHRAVFNRQLSRIEMHLVSLRRQIVRIAGRSVSFEAGETIHTENSYKYTEAGFRSLAEAAGWTTERVLTDPDHLFAVLILRAR